MTDTRRIRTSLTRNAAMAALQVVFSGGILFFLYRYLLQTIGSQALGIWAIVLATASASRISEMGFASSAVKFTAKYIALGEPDKAADAVQTTILTIAAALMVVLASSYPIISWLMRTIIPVTDVHSALAILPHALVSVWVGALAGVSLSGLDGCQRHDLRAHVSILAALALLALAWLLVPKYGLIGLAWAQIIQGAFMLFTSWVLLRRELSTLPMMPYLWRYSLFAEMFQYGLSFQTASIAAMLFEPTTKALMAKFGGLSTTAYYEMASRMVMQFRSLIVSANQVVVPRVATLHENAPDRIQSAYLESYQLVFFLSVSLYALVAAASPLISQLWIGHYEPSFVLFSVLFSAGVCINTLSGPAYFFNLGIGNLRSNTVGHITVGVLNLGLGYFLGSIFGGVGVASGYILAFIIGSGVIMLQYQYDHQVPFVSLIPEASKPLVACCLSGLLAAWAAIHYIEIRSSVFGNSTFALLICVAIVGPAIWLHPLSKTLISRAAGEFRKTG